MRTLFANFTRGIVYLFTLKLSIILIILTVASCSQDDTAPDQSELEAVTKFTSYVKGSFSNRIIRSQANLEDNELTEEAARAMLQPMQEKSLEFLKDLGFEENVINEELGGIDNPQTMLVALLVLDELRQAQLTSANQLEIDALFFSQAKAFDGEVLPCLGEAFGFAAVGYILQEGIEAALAHYGTKGLLKILGKAAGRTLGWVGAALAAYEFAQCLKH